MGTHGQHDVTHVGIPESLPASTPSFASPDHSFTLQAVMDMQRNVGALTASINALIEGQKDLSRKMERVEEKLSGVTHKLYAAGVVLALALGLGGWLVNASWGILKDVAATAIKTGIEQAPQSQAPAPSHKP